MIGYIHSFESLAALDGEGLRYAVFLAGCKLRCVYCHNPDTWDMAGNKVTPEELFQKIKRYKPYFKNNGGATFTGGEPLLQAKFIEEVIPYLKKEKIGYVIDTSGTVNLNDCVKNVLDNADEVLLDLKFYDNESYLKYTKCKIDNVLKTLDYLEKTNKKTRIRTVIVPGLNDDFKILDNYINIIKNKASVYKYELLGFHTMGFFKYENLNIENPLKNTPAQDKTRLEELQQYIDDKIKKRAF